MERSFTDALIIEVNQLRLSPSSYVQYLHEFRKLFEDDFIYKSSSGRRFRTKKGRSGNMFTFIPMHPDGHYMRQRSTKQLKFCMDPRRSVLYLRQLNLRRQLLIMCTIAKRVTLWDRGEVMAVDPPIESRGMGRLRSWSEKTFGTAACLLER